MFLTLNNKKARVYIILLFAIISYLFLDVSVYSAVQVVSFWVLLTIVAILNSIFLKRSSILLNHARLKFLIFFILQSVAHSIYSRTNLSFLEIFIKTYKAHIITIVSFILLLLIRSYIFRERDRMLLLLEMNVNDLNDYVDRQLEKENRELAKFIKENKIIEKLKKKEVTDNDKNDKIVNLNVVRNTRRKIRNFEDYESEEE